MERRNYATIFFIATFLVILYLFYQILRPFVVPIAWAAILVAAFHPLYRLLTKRLKGGKRLASLLCCMLISLIIVAPVILLVMVLAKESVDAYARLQQFLQSPNFESTFHIKIIDELSAIAGRFVDLEKINPKAILLGALSRISSFLVSHTSHILQSFTGFVFSFFIMLITMYFFFLDGEKLLEELKRLNPLPHEYEQAVLRQLREVSFATLYGSILTSLAQGLAGALVFFFLGLPSPLLWGAVMALLSFIPLLGTFLVWLPVSIYLLLTGSIGKGIALLTLGAVVIGSIDNILKPMLIKGKVRTHTLLVFFSVLGGLKAFGFLGLVLGPLVVTLFQTFLNLYKLEFREELGKKLAPKV